MKSLLLFHGSGLVEPLTQTKKFTAIVIAQRVEEPGYRSKGEAVGNSRSPSV